MSEPIQVGGYFRCCKRCGAEYLASVVHECPSDPTPAGTGAGEPTNDHPEAHCWRCGGPNVSWCAPSPLWNEVMRGGDINGPDLHQGIVCPTCFAVLAEAAGIASGWRMQATVVTRQLPAVTPSGRVWDDKAWLWVEPGAAPVAADARPEAGERAWPVVRDILVRHRETWNHGRGDSLLGPMMAAELDRILTEVRAATPPGAASGTREREAARAAWRKAFFGFGPFDPPRKRPDGTWHEGETAVRPSDARLNCAIDAALRAAVPPPSGEPGEGVTR